MAEAVAVANRDHRKTRPDGSQQFWRRRRGAAMMSNLEKISPWRFGSDEFLHLLLQVAGQQRAGAAIGNEERQRVVVHWPAFRMPIGRRREHANVRSAPIEFIARNLAADGNAVRCCSRGQLVQRFGLWIDA